MDSCCAGSPTELMLGAKTRPSALTVISKAPQAEVEFITIPAGPFAFGSNDPDANPLDNEGPIREVELREFEISSTPITNAQFSQFVAETGYVTEAEENSWSFVFQLLVSDEAEVIGESQGAPWWLGVKGASWRNPFGDKASYLDLLDHPAVHISYQDALAFCNWSKTSLPDELQWEKAARGGLVSNRYPWGNELLAGGQWQCNIFQGEFPTHNTEEDGFVGTSPVKSFGPNGYGGYDFSGNVWEWTTTDFAPPESLFAGPALKVTRGGSYLCHDSYCNRYRVGARNRTPVDSLAGNIGFRVVRSVA